MIEEFGRELMRSDRALDNNQLATKYCKSLVVHLPKVNSDHAPHWLKISTAKLSRYFKFLNLQTMQDGFKEVIKQVQDKKVGDICADTKELEKG